jgi:hypothetical protein
LRCELVKTEECSVPIDDFKNKEFKIVEEFELKPYGRQIQCHDSIMGYELTTNIITKDK